MAEIQHALLLAVFTADAVVSAVQGQGYFRHLMILILSLRQELFGLLDRVIQALGDHGRLPALGLACDRFGRRGGEHIALLPGQGLLETLHAGFKIIDRIRKSCERLC